MFQTMLKALFRDQNSKTDPQSLYGEVVARARSVPFFADFGVPDTFDGRFELMVMHVYLVISRFNQEGNAAKEKSQHLFDLFLDDMSIGLREAGVGDTTVPKRLKKMSRVFYGRAAAWDEAFASNEVDETLAKVFARNLFDLDAANANSMRLASYMIAEKANLSARSYEEIGADEPIFSTPL